MEETYARRIVALLEPLVGQGKVRAEVNASVDFTEAEEVSESYGTERSALRSEQTAEDIKRGGMDAQGIPGALTNQPPEDVPQTPPGAQTRPAAQAEAASDQALAAAEPISTSRRATRNYEIDRMLSRKRPAPGNLRKLSVAVLVDAGPATASADAGAAGATAAPEAADVERMTGLVKQAIGFDAQRGDSVSVISAAFQVEEQGEEVSGTPVWQSPVLLTLLKQAFGVLLVALVVFTVLRPVARRLSEPGAFAAGPAGADLLGRQGVAVLPGGGASMLQGMNHEQQIAAARNLVGQDPRRVAQTMKRWLDHDG
jgi:flagellar M-ring protein FliF